MAGFTRKQKDYIREFLDSRYYANPVPLPDGLEGCSDNFIRVLATGDLTIATQATKAELKKRQYLHSSYSFTEGTRKAINRHWGDYLSYMRSDASVGLKVDLGGGRFHTVNIYIKAIPVYLKRLG